MIVILDYGMGNVVSIKNSLLRLGYESVISSDLEDIRISTHLILPGVGSFHTAMKKLTDLNLITVIKSYALIEKKPILGICLGMQILGLSSPEGELHNGLGLIDNNIKKFNTSDKKYTVPHVGFNCVSSTSDSKDFLNIPENSDFYFSHSFYMLDNDKNAKYTYCNHQIKFVASFILNNIHGSQFHPEKSQDSGLLFIRNFLESYNA